MSGGYADHFSAGAADYGEFRPSYPAALFDTLTARLRVHDLAWDCATGSGQALDGLATRFVRVVASDASLAQLRQARPRGNVTLIAARAEQAPLADASVDLLTVAQALHWFDLPRFFAEAVRVLKPGGLLAVWTYNLLTVTPAVDAVVTRFYRDGVGRWWPADRRLVEEAYAGIELPWGGGRTETLWMSAAWDAARLAAYVGTWSAVGCCRRATGDDPLPAFAAELAAAWNGSEARTVRWPLTLKSVRKPA